VQTYGADLGVTYAFTPQLSAALNYSWFGYSLDKNDLANDGNKDGRVTDLDLPINTPANKASVALNYSSSKWFGSIFTRWVERYNFFSGINVASETIPELGIRENARFGRTFNYGPLGGFVNVDVSAGYRFGKVVTLSGQVSNLFNARVYEFVGSPIIGRLYSLELKVNIPAIGSKK
jgi:iron complex outermembrane receptor protein